MIRYINQVYLIYQYIHNFGENIFLWEMMIISSISSYNRFTYSERNCLYCISDFFKCVTKLAKKGKSVTNFFFVLESHLFAIIKVNYSKQYWSGYNFCVLNIL